MKKYYDCNEEFDMCRRYDGRSIESTECMKCDCGSGRRDGRRDGYDGYDGDDCFNERYAHDGCCQRRFKNSLRHLIGVTVRLFISNETVITGIILCVSGDEVKVLERNTDRVIVIRDKDIVYVEEPRFFPQF